MRTLIPVHVTLALAGSDHKANEDVNNNEEEHWMWSLSLKCHVHVDIN